MKIECAGTRGSIARGSAEFSRFGGDTISIQITAESGDIVIIDAGTGIQTFGNRIQAAPNSIKKPIHLFFTHYHMDHIVGLTFFKPIYDKSQEFIMYGPRLEGAEGCEQAFRNMITPPYSPVTFDGHEIKAKIDFKTISEEVFHIGSLKITSIRINHPNHGGLGYKIEENGKSFVLLTDNELKYSHLNGRRFEDFVEFCRGVDLVFHDAQFFAEEYHKFKGWGHSTAEDVIELALQAECREVGFFHFSPDRTDSEIEQLYPNEITDRAHLFPLVQGTCFIL